MENSGLTQSTQQTTVKEKTRSRPAVVILSSLLMIATVGVGFLAYAWLAERQAAIDKGNELSLTKEALVAANQDNITEGQSQQEAQKLPNFGTFISAYNAMLSASPNVSIDRVKEDQAIMQALKDYYKTQTLPQGVAVLSIYQVVKPETPPSGDYYALVYWPQGEKPASFIPLIKPKGGTWKYEEML